MSSGHHTDIDRLDTVARQAHAAALEGLSPRVRAQLAQRRRAAMQGPRPAPVRPWGLMAVGSAALLALAVGVFALRDAADPGTAPPSDALAAQPASQPQSPPPGTDPALAPAIAPGAPQMAQAATPAQPDASATTAPTTEVVEVESLPDTWVAAEFEDADAEAAFAGFEETPDFYLWLGSEQDSAEFTESL